MCERRQHVRRRTYFGGTLVHPSLRSQTSCMVRELSSGGARLQLSAAVPVPSRFQLDVACLGASAPVEIVWRSGEGIGVRFCEDIAPTNIAQQGEVGPTEAASVPYRNLH